MHLVTVIKYLHFSLHNYIEVIMLFIIHSKYFPILLKLKLLREGRKGGTNTAIPHQNLAKYRNCTVTNGKKLTLSILQILLSSDTNPNLVTFYFYELTAF